jgi:xanthine dehydrogenase accessory factor
MTLKVRLAYLLNCPLDEKEVSIMENIDITVLRQLYAWRSEGKKAVLVTVIRTWGSSPRPIGSIMALCEDSRVVGSISGGCIEDDLIRQHLEAKVFDEKLPLKMQYGITADEAHRFGLPCGGTLELMLEYNPTADELGELIKHLSLGHLVARQLELSTGNVSLVTTEQPAELVISETDLINTFGPEFRMLIIGAGQMSEYLATMALFNGFSVTVCDPRQEYIGNWSVLGVAINHGSPDDVVTQFKPDSRTCVVALTHDPKLDDLALLEALETDAFYVGAIGSRRNNSARKMRMKEHFGHTDSSLEKLKGPIGIYIGSKTPAEIAVSVMAEVLAVKNGVSLSKEMSVEQAKKDLEA